MQTDSDQILLDLRGLAPPEPLERVIDALANLPPGRRLRMLIEREPLPLYHILQRNGYSYETTARGDDLFDITIRTPG